jgi:hypothetical protein
VPILSNARHFYVYFLIDPRDESILYVGKGKGKRISQHVRNVRNGKWDNGAKCARIHAIHAAGLEVVEQYHQTGLDEGEAFAIERELISALRDQGITNIASGTVTARQAACAQLRWLLDNMKSFHEWKRTRPDIVASCEKAFGSAYHFYQRWIREVEGELRHWSQSEIEIIQGKIIARG